MIICIHEDRTKEEKKNMAVPGQVRSGRRWAFDDASSSAAMLSTFAPNRIVSDSLNSKGYCQVYH